MANGNNVGLWYGDAYFAFYVGSDGTLVQSIAGAQGYYLTGSGMFDPDSALDLKRRSYDPASGDAFNSFTITGRKHSDQNVQVFKHWHPRFGWWDEEAQRP